MLHNRLARDMLLLLSGGILPVDVDFSTLADGNLPSDFMGSTWSISSGVAVNSPTLGSEQLTDPGLEANYTAGKCDTLTKTGTPTLAQSADVHGGSKAQEFTAAAANNALYWGPLNKGGADVWHLFTVWAKRTAGTGNNVFLSGYQAGAMPGDQIVMLLDSATYVQAQISVITTSTGNFFRRVYATAASDTVIFDDGSHKYITQSSLYALLPATQPDVIVKVQPDTLPSYDATLWGIVIRANAQTSPTNCIYVIGRRYPTSTLLAVSVVKKIGSTYTSVLVETVAAIASLAWLEARISGNTLKVYYNNTQVGGDLTISDAELTSNGFHGMFSSGGASFLRFFCTSQLTAMSQMWAGTSFTASNPGYRVTAQNWEKANLPGYAFTFPTTLAIGGHSTWSNLVRLTTGYDLFIIDTANDDSDMDEKALEALIRRLWDAKSSTRIIFISSPSWVGQDTGVDANVNTPSNIVMLGLVSALAALYGIPVVDYWGWCVTVVTAGTYHLNELTDDTVHPNALGYANMAALLEAYLPNGGGMEPATLPTRIYDDGSFENTPTITNGTDYDSRTGAGWSDTGTRTQSSTAGDTITYSAYCQSFGCYRADAGSNDVTVSIDGGAFTAMAFYQNGTEVPAGLDNHTFEIKVVSGTVRIDEFWAI